MTNDLPGPIVPPARAAAPRAVVLQMLQPSFDVKSISAKRRNKSNPWFKRGTLFRNQRPGNACHAIG
jgi:hypothetical protein